MSDKSIPHREQHGKYKTSEYRSWVKMKSRCLNLNADNYDRYGGRGISVCEKWRNSFQAFFDDMGEKPSSTHTIDRIDNEGNYEPDNCKWSSTAEQSINKRMQKRNKTGVPGVELRENGRYVVTISFKRKKHHIGCYGTIEEAAAARKAGELKYWS